MVQARLLLACAILSLNVATAVAQGINGTVLAEDPRLAKTVSISQTHISVGELLSTFSQQTGVDLVIDDLSTSSGYDLLVHCDGIPLGQMMDAVCSLCSTRTALWKWLRQGTSPQYTYLLVEPKAAKLGPERYRAFARRAYSDYLELMRRLSEMSPAERHRHTGEARDTLNLEPSAIEALFTTKQFWNDAKLFFGLLSRDQQEQLLDSGTTHSFHVDDLSPELAGEYHAAFAASNSATVLADGTRIPDPVPQEFSISAEAPSATNGCVAPTIAMRFNGKGGRSMLGTGFLNFTVKSTIAKDWRIPGDLTASPAGERVVPIKPGQSTQHDQIVGPDGHFRNTTIPGAMAGHLMQMARGTSIPILAILPGEQVDIGSPVNKRIKDLLDPPQEFGFQEIYKWRGDVLLLTNPEWFLEEQAVVAYRWTRKLFGTKEALSGLVDLIEMTARLSPEQTEWLAKHFGLKSLPRISALLTYANAHHNLVSADGAELSPDDVIALRDKFCLPQNVKFDRPMRVRLVPGSPRENEWGCRRFRVEMFDSMKSEWEKLTDQDLESRY